MNMVQGLQKCCVIGEVQHELVAVNRKAYKLQAKMILQVHDELNFDVPKNELDQVKEIVKQQMEHAVDIGLPLTVEMDAGVNWMEAH